METEASLTTTYMEGYLRRYKNSKKRYVILLKHKLAFYESNKKYKELVKPKKIIYLTDILHILRLSEKKYPFSFAIFTNDNKICLVADSEEEVMRWLNSIKTLRKERIDKENITNGKEWLVDLKNRGIGHDLCGCVTLRVTLESVEFSTDDVVVLSIPSWMIKRCGYTEHVVFIELCENEEYVSNELWFEMNCDDDVEEVNRMIHSLNKPRSKTVREKNMIHRSPVYKRSSSQTSYHEANTYKAYGGLSYSADYETTASSKQSCSSSGNMSRSSSTEIQELKNQLTDALYGTVFLESNNLESGNKTPDIYSIRAHLLSKTGGIHKSSTSSSLADDESELVDECTGKRLDPSSPALEEAFVKFNFSPDNQKRLRKKQNRQRDHREESPTLLQRPSSVDSLDENMNPVSLLSLTTETEHFGEPFYEAVKVPKLKGIIAKSPRNSNNTTPESSPRSYNRKYKLSTGKPKQLSSPTSGQPPLPKRNHSASSFYLSTDEYEDMCGYETLNNNTDKNTNTIDHVTNTIMAHDHVIYGNSVEPKYIDIETIDRIKQSLVSEEGHGYTEIVTKPRPSTRSLSLNQEHTYSNREIVHIRKSSHTKSDESIQEEDENISIYENNYLNKSNSRPGQTEARGRPPTRSRSAPATHGNYDYVTSKYKARSPVANMADQANADVVLEGISEDWVLPDSSEKDIRYDNYNDEPSYENSELSNIEFMNTQKKMMDMHEPVAYDNVDFPHRLPAHSISYAEIELYNKELKKDEQHKQDKRGDRTEYTQIDFKKSRGIHEALKGIRESFTPSHDGQSEYLTDMTHKNFRKGHQENISLKTT